MNTILAEKIEQLSPEIQREIEQLVDKLLGSQAENQPGKLKLDWRGALIDLRDKYTSVELQHEILKLWVKDAPPR